MPRFHRRLAAVLLAGLTSPSAMAVEYQWFGTNGGDGDPGTRRTVFNGDSLSVYAEANWENTALPGTPPANDAINNSNQVPAGINAPVLIDNGFVAGGTNGAGPGSQFRTNGHALQILNPGSGLKINNGMIQNDGIAGGTRSSLTVAEGAFLMATQLQDISATLRGHDSRIFFTTANTVHSGLENSTIDLLPDSAGPPEIFWVNQASPDGILAALPSITLAGQALVLGDNSFEWEPGDTALLIARTGLAYQGNVLSSYRQLPGNSNTTTNGYSLRILPQQSLRFWDVNGSQPGAGGIDPNDPQAPAAPDGTWSEAAANWTPNHAGDVETGTWVPGLAASFNAASDTTGDFIVSIPQTVQLAALHVENGTLELSGGALQFPAEGNILVGNGSRLWLDTEILGRPVARVEGSSILYQLGDLELGGFEGTGRINAGLFDLNLHVETETTSWGIIDSAATVIKSGPGNLRLVRPQNGIAGTLDLREGTLTVARVQANSGGIENVPFLRIRPEAQLDLRAKTTTIPFGHTITGNGEIFTNDRLTYTGTSYATQTVTIIPGLTLNGTLDVPAAASPLRVGPGRTRFAAGSTLRFHLDENQSTHGSLELGGPIEVFNGAILELAVSGTPGLPVYELIRYQGTAPALPFTVVGLPDGYRLDPAYLGDRVALLRESPAGFAAWAAGFGITEAAFAQDGPDADGIPLGVEYALGLDPLAFDSLPVLQNTPDGFLLLAPKGSAAAADPSIRFRFERSTNLSTWEITEPSSQDANSFRLLLPPGEFRFLRIRIDQTE